MATYTITDDCISCGACEPECPENSISAGEDKYMIDQNKCTACATCASVCPVEACIPA